MKRKIGILVLLALLCAFVLGVIGCSDRESTDESEGQLAEIDVQRMTITETPAMFLVSWVRVDFAESYIVTCEGVTVKTTSNSINLRNTAGVVFPDTGEITFTIVATGYGYKDSKPVTINYKAEGIQLRSPEIISFDNGVIEWSTDRGANTFILKVNNSFVSDSADSLYRAKTYDLSSLTSDARIDITALGDDVWVKSSATTSFMYSVAQRELTMLPASGYTIENEQLSWNAIGGATGYKVVDIDYNVSVVSENSYDMSSNNLVRGVYPITQSNLIRGAEITTDVKIKYLEGSGTAQDPYLIKTPFDLRAIDYYETRFAEFGGQRNYYRLENDIDYNTVSALESDSNMYTLHKPFYGTLDGNGKKLSNVRINYDGGYWALFDFMTAGSIVKDITFDNPEINNKSQDQKHPINSTIAMVAYRNYGSITNVTVNNAKFTAITGEISGIVSHNYGTVSSCTVSGTFVEGDTAMNENATAAYEMGGIVLENCKGGIVDGNKVTTLTMRGTANNICTAAGICSVNRAGGIVRNNSYDSVTVTNMNASSEYGGVTAYDATATPGTVQGTGTLGTFIVGTTTVTTSNGTSAVNKYGKLVGKCG